MALKFKPFWNDSHIKPTFRTSFSPHHPAVRPPPSPCQRPSPPDHHSVACSADQIILSTPCTTVATETPPMRVWERVRYCWGIGCRGLDAFQSNLLLGCGSPPPPTQLPHAPTRVPPWRKSEKERLEDRGCRLLGQTLKSLEGDVYKVWFNLTTDINIIFMLFIVYIENHCESESLCFWYKFTLLSLYS